MTSGTAPIASRPYRMNSPSFRQSSIVDSYLTAGLIEHSTSDCRSPLVEFPQPDGNIRIAINYKRPNRLVCRKVAPAADRRTPGVARERQGLLEVETLLRVLLGRYPS